VPADLPSAWSFGATSDHADELLELVLSGTKTGTASSLWGHEATGEPVPRPGELSIILDGTGRPRAVEAFAGAPTAGRALGVELLRLLLYL
jgi:uncharacterized protein YhfF